MDMVISVTKHLPGPSPTLWSPLKSSQNVLPSFGVERTNGGGGECHGFVPITFWPGGALELRKQ